MDSIQGYTCDLDPPSKTTFLPCNWLADTSLASLLGIPIGRYQLKIMLKPENKIGEETMILHIGEISHEACSKYPALDENPPF